MLKHQCALKRCSQIFIRRPQAGRRSSTTIDLSKLESGLRERKLPVIRDILSPQPSNLLYRSLKDFLHDSPSRRLVHPSQHARLPPGHHLVYFPPPTTASQLLPDGTDTLHSPGPPFTQRLWAGGRVQFKHPDLLRLDNRDVALVERITDVRVAGGQGFEKIFVGIERRIGIWIAGESNDTTRERITKDVGEINSNTALIERRNLCFLRSDASPPFRADKPRRALKPPSDAAFVYALTPTPALLFRFSALTFNAHAIHIDPEYTRNVYGLPKLLVHGPLCLALMLECLSRAVKGSKRRMIAEINYRNYSPVFVGEELRVCGKMRAAEGQEWEVWIETGVKEEATLAVRGTASVTGCAAERTP